MNGNILDTNVIIRIIKGDNAVAEQARKLKSIHTVDCCYSDCERYDGRNAGQAF